MAAGLHCDVFDYDALRRGLPAVAVERFDQSREGARAFVGLAQVGGANLDVRLTLRASETIHRNVMQRRCLDCDHALKLIRRLEGAGRLQDCVCGIRRGTSDFAGR
ncbi:hypothetical protein [Candidatus Viadribacter manganicus]|uniref:hypothetical protein n=1 Tax=Candidatus Viadribacter manganicus TaxID=1759059 RepID=UPI0009F28CDC